LSLYSLNFWHAFLQLFVMVKQRIEIMTEWNTINWTELEQAGM
jgi:hypothetical protein